MQEPLEGIQKTKGMWEYVMEPTESFKDEIQMLRIPNKVKKRMCHTCFGNITIKCNTCTGTGKVLINSVICISMD